MIAERERGVVPIQNHEPNGGFGPQRAAFHLSESRIDAFIAAFTVNELHSHGYVLIVSAAGQSSARS